jgi:hypothetical protein
LDTFAAHAVRENCFQSEEPDIYSLAYQKRRDEIAGDCTDRFAA